MQFEHLTLSGIILITPKRFKDSRGFFMETFRQDLFEHATGQPTPFVQDNHSYSAAPHTVRGLHYQSPPHAQGKLVRCVRGAILDIAVDMRTNSPTYGQHVKAELSAENAAQLWIPPGFLHGFITKFADTEVAYKCTGYYDKDCDGNIVWDDPDLNINWGITKDKVVLSAKDRDAPRFRDFSSPF